jgi:SET domain-containing protein
LVTKQDVLDTPMMDYVFKINDELYALALGSGSLYNHRNQPNARWHYDEDKQRIVFRAARAIKPGEEIFISYGKDYWKTRDVSMKGDINKTDTTGIK